MPSQNMLPKGQRRRSVRPEYVATRGVEVESPVEIPLADFEDGVAGQVRSFVADAAAAGMRVDAYLAQALPDVSRARVQLLVEAGQVRMDGAAVKAKTKLKGGERIEIEGEPHPEPLHATPEDIPLDILVEDQYLAVVDKPAGMMVHAGSGDEEHNRGTLVNALLFHLQKERGELGLSTLSGDLRPGIVHRLDKMTSGAIVVAKDDVTHRKLGEMFAAREVKKSYLALAHGHIERDDTTVTLAIARDLVRRTRMTTRRMAAGSESGGAARSAISHVHVLERLTTPFGRFTLVEVAIETGRTHQIRVHLQALGHPVVGDFLYGAPHIIRRTEAKTDTEPATLELERNFLHAARIGFPHPRTGKALELEAPLSRELVEFLEKLRG
jgi:23S rRNA pseudouridine1911/1915/1917 synthase